jgi:WhiB family redox-sensing transcriptional regulator
VPVVFGPVRAVTRPPDYFRDTVADALGGGGDRSWMDRAACIGAESIDFFPSGDESAAPAIEVCNGCAVSSDCLAYALTHKIADGVWGGTDERARKRMLRQRPKRPAA